MIDFHSHILPRIDDGSKSIEESAAMLHELHAQGVDAVVATPHFYADVMSPEEFLQKRNRSFEELKPHLDENMPDIILGAEVLYYEGICHTRELYKLCIENTDVLLLEMPTVHWSDRMMNTVLELCGRDDLTVLLAHIERYVPFNKKEIRFLSREGIPMQISTDIFSDKKSKRFALKTIKKGIVQVLGTDCHNMQNRKPDFAPAVKEIENSLGAEFISRIEAEEARLLNG